jgi:flagellar basal-body rod modification protein FlgD
MAVDSVSSLTSSQAQLKLQDFVRILSAQLNNQDPLQPMDNTEFLAQLAQFSGLEQSRQLNDKMDTLLTVQATAQSVGLIGRTIDAQTEYGNLSGQVIQVSFSNGEPRLTVQTPNGEAVSDLTLSQVAAVH